MRGTLHLHSMLGAAVVNAMLLVGCGGDGAEITAPTGSLEIRTTTTGEATGDYTFSVDGGAVAPIGANGTVALTDIVPGSHIVELTGLPQGCTVAGENPRTAGVTAGARTTVSFAVTCTPAPEETGTLVITTPTTGSDPDGFQVAIDGGSPQLIGENGSVTLSNLAPGIHTVLLSGEAAGCTIEGENPRTVNVTAGATVEVRFAVTCASPGPQIAFSSNARGLQAIFVVRPDGSGLRSLTPAGTFDRDPVWSPDGSKILFASGGVLHLMNGDGSSRQPVVNGQEVNAYRWSPDGSMVAYTVERVEGEDVFSDLWVVHSDGSGSIRIALNASSPTWAPDGRRIAYASDFFGDQQVHVVNIDGSGDIPLTNLPIRAIQTAWSPDGSRIAFVSLPDKNIMLINPDGTAPVNLTLNQAADDSPVWSPDGTTLAFNTGPFDQPLESEVAVMNRDGTGRRVLTSHEGFDFGPDWSPDGSRIVFTRSDPGDSEVYVMNRDGAAQTNVSNRGDAFDTAPDWGGPGQPPLASRLFSGQLDRLHRRLPSPQ